MNATELLNNAAQLSASDFDHFVQQVLALRVRRKGLGMDSREAVLLKKLNQKSLSGAQQKRFDYLTQAANRTEKEQQELLILIERIEQFDVERLEYLTELAQLRKVPLRTLMQQLGLLRSQHG